MITLRIKFYTEEPDGTVDYAEPSFHPRNLFALFDSSEMEDVLTEPFAQIQEAIEKRTQNGSGWIVDLVVFMHITISRYQPLRGGSYIELPKYISNKNNVHQCKKTRMIIV